MKKSKKEKGPQKVWVISVDGEVKVGGFTSLSGACSDCGVSYSTASKGERVFKVKGSIVRLYDVLVVKIRGREKNGKLSNFKKNKLT